MTKTTPDHLQNLVERAVRLFGSEERTETLNPTQRAALSYLSRANRFSRSPSNVTDYLLATKGTVSQTLKSLLRKGLIRQEKSETDKRSISYAPTEKGDKEIERLAKIEHTLSRLPESTRNELVHGLEAYIRLALNERGNAQFGICKACQHHEFRKTGGFCSLLEEELEEVEIDQICKEYLETI